MKKILHVAIPDLILWLNDAVYGIRHRILLNCLVGGVRIVLSLSFVYLCKHIVDIATRTVEGNIYHWIFGLVGIVFLQLIATLVNARVKERNRIELTNHLRKRIFARAMNSEWNGRDRLHSGDTMSRLSEDIRNVCTTVSDHFPQLVVASFQLIAASVVLFMLGRELMWTLLFIMPLAIVVSKLYYRRLRTLTNEVRKTEGDIQSHMQEHLLKRVLVLCMGRLDNVVQTLDSQQISLHDTVISRVNYSTRAHLYIQMGFMTGYCVTFCWGALGILEGTVTYGMMTAFLQLVNQVQMPIVNMSQHVPAMVHAMTSVQRLQEVDEEIQQESSADDLLRNLNDGPLGLRVDEISFTYPDSSSPTLEHLSFDFKPAQHTAIVGPTGQGKSTLIRLLLGLLKPSEGSIVLYDTDGTEVILGSASRSVFCYVPQGNSLMSGTVRDNLLLADPLATEDEMREVLRLAAADFVFDREEGLDTSCAEQGGGLSEGQAQRIAIARALLQPGRILLFDEACSALDDDTERRILDNLDSCVKERTILWITHDESVRRRMSETLIL